MVPRKSSPVLLALAALSLAGCSGPSPSPSASPAPPSVPTTTTQPTTPAPTAAGATNAAGFPALPNGTSYSERNAETLAAIIGPSAVPVKHAAAAESVTAAATSLMGYTVDPAPCAPIAQSVSLSALVPSTYSEAEDPTAKITYSLAFIPPENTAPRLPAVARALQECSEITVEGAGQRLTLTTTPTELTKQGGVSYFGFSVKGSAFPGSTPTQMYAENEAGTVRLIARSSDPSVTPAILKKTLSEAAPKVFALPLQ